MLNNDVKEYSLFDQEFHYTIVVASDNKELIKFIRLLNQKSYLSRIRTLSFPGQMDRSIVEHHEILLLHCIKGQGWGWKKASAHVKDALDRYINISRLKFFVFSLFESLYQKKLIALNKVFIRKL